MSAGGTILAWPMAHPVLGGTFSLPKGRRVDARLLGGSALFGIGWGLAGFCPGPALTALSLDLPKAFVFMGAMLLGMLLFKLMPERHPSS